MKIVFVGFVGSSNIGDRLIVESLTQNLFKEHEVQYYDFNFNKAENVYKSTLLNKNHKFTDKIRSSLIYNKIRKYNFIDFIVNKYIQASQIKSFNNSSIKEAIKNSDFVVLGGGNTAFDLSKYSNSALKIKLIVDCANKFNKKVFITSSGIGPFFSNEQERKTVNIFKSADYVTLRDLKSYKYFQKFDAIDSVYQSIDPVFVYKPERYSKISNNDKINIGINIMDLSYNKNSELEISGYLNAIRQLVLKLLKDEKFELHLFSSEVMDNNVVMDFYNEFKEKNNVHFIEVLSEDDLFMFYSTLDFVIGTRMHALITAIISKIPVIGIVWQPKVEFMFKNINIQDKYLNLKSIIENPDKLYSKFEEMINYNNSFDFESILNDANKKFEINNEILENIINNIEGEINGE